MSTTKYSSYLRSFIFGVEDSLVSTIGLISGVAAAGATKSTVILTGVILVFVEAFSMGVGMLLSENSVQEFKSKKDVSLENSVSTGLVMFLSYLVAGFFVVAPYFITTSAIAFYSSIVVSLVLLFILGIISAYFSQTSKIKKGLIMAFVGGLAIFVGIVVGQIINSYIL